LKEKERAVAAIERNGKVDPNDLISAAQAKDHPCHEDFTWDIRLAAQECWRSQARKLIRQFRFAVLVGETRTPVPKYVPSPDDDDVPVFVSLPKVRSNAKTSAILATEIAMLHGNAARVYGIALAKQGIVGSKIVSRLREIRDQLAEIDAEME
jgi:hypothetical protein